MKTKKNVVRNELAECAIRFLTRQLAEQGSDRIVGHLALQGRHGVNDNGVVSG
jgi:hypothetical protein